MSQKSQKVKTKGLKKGIENFKASTGPAAQQLRDGILRQSKLPFKTMEETSEEVDVNDKTEENNKRQREATPTKLDDDPKHQKLSENTKETTGEMPDWIAKVVVEMKVGFAKMESKMTEMDGKILEIVNKMTIGVNENKEAIKQNRENTARLNERIGKVDKRLVPVEDNYTKLKRDLNSCNDTLNKWGKDRVTRQDFNAMEDKIETTANLLANIREGGDHDELLQKFSAMNEEKRKNKDDATLIISRLPRRANMLPEALLANLHAVLSLPPMPLTVSALDKENTALKVELSSKANMMTYWMMLKKSLKWLQGTKPENKEIIKVTRILIEQYFDANMIAVKKKMKQLATSLFENEKLRSFRFVKEKDHLLWILRADTPLDLADNKRLECWRIYAEAGEDIVDVSDRWNGYLGFNYDAERKLLIKDWRR